MFVGVSASVRVVLCLSSHLSTVSCRTSLLPSSSVKLAPNVKVNLKISSNKKV